MRWADEITKKSPRNRYDDDAARCSGEGFQALAKEKPLVIAKATAGSNSWRYATAASSAQSDACHSLSRCCDRRVCSRSAFMYSSQSCAPRGACIPTITLKPNTLVKKSRAGVAQPTPTKLRPMRDDALHEDWSGAIKPASAGADQTRSPRRRPCGSSASTAKP
jgi:hypothetical protein